MMISSPVFAGDAEAGKAKAVTCAACHGANGISAIPLYPNLAGQKEAYIAQQLRNFKSGERNNAIMKGMVMALSEADMDNLAAYYANMK
jgi:cytochrome c553